MQNSFNEQTDLLRQENQVLTQEFIHKNEELLNTQKTMRSKIDDFKSGEFISRAKTGTVTKGSHRCFGPRKEFGTKADSSA